MSSLEDFVADVLGIERVRKMNERSSDGVHVGSVPQSAGIRKDTLKIHFRYQGVSNLDGRFNSIPSLKPWDASVDKGGPGLHPAAASS